MIELLVVMAILGILAVVGLSSFRTSQAKSRDAKRKSDLEQIQRALEMYNNDHGSYPASGVLVWGEEFTDPDGDTVYMAELPEDPSVNLDYCYQSPADPLVSSVSYQLYATLENSQDPRCLGGNCTPATSCGTGTYNYGVSSSNTTP